ncbi:hypothetical protein [Cecembia rubra]|uniref:Uncharacterized protein n=2 Tax=Cecembia TaxID=1187078 RepID=A0A4Q7P5M9_9BACT|nr:hypothetical protein [Cecembia rubra]PSL03023.1 hypothetical protein CLV48_108133 [Cecembia rubra]RZS95346.1 hypothetical protein BC751_0868 [Cecembia calidifontis]
MEKTHRWSKFNIKLTVLKALKKGIISKNEAKMVLDADDPSNYMFLTEHDEDEIYSKTKKLLERLGIITPLIFVDENGNIC